jgi:biotin synthase
MPKAQIRISAGRAKMSVSDQALCFMAGANSIFSSENQRMLTSAVPTQDYEMDRQMMEILGLNPKASAASDCHSSCAAH